MYPWDVLYLAIAVLVWLVVWITWSVGEYRDLVLTRSEVTVGDIADKVFMTVLPSFTIGLAWIIALPVIALASTIGRIRVK